MSILRAERVVKGLQELDADPEHMVQVLRVRAKRIRSWLSQETVPADVHLDQLEWWANQFRCEKAVKESDLPVCEWIEGWAPPDPLKRMREFNATLQEFRSILPVARFAERVRRSPIQSMDLLVPCRMRQLGQCE